MKAIKEFLPIQPGDVPSTFSDCSSLENLLISKPNTSIKDGIKHLQVGTENFMTNKENYSGYKYMYHSSHWIRVCWLTISN